MIVNRLPAHTADAVEAWLQGREDEIEMFYLPRGGRTPLELFLAGVQSWNAGMRRILSWDSDGVAQS
jgi:hypothetical protein